MKPSRNLRARVASSLIALVVVSIALVSQTSCSRNVRAEAGQDRMKVVEEKIARVQKLAPRWVESGGDAELIQTRMRDVRRLLDSGNLAQADAQLDAALELVRGSAAAAKPVERRIPEDFPTKQDSSVARVALGLPLSPFDGMKRPQEALARMREAGSSMFGVRVAWDRLEPKPGRIDLKAAPLPMLEIVDKDYPELLETLVVSVRVVTTTVRTMPKDLERLPFDDERVLERIDGVIDGLASHRLANKIDYILLGQETDVYLARHPDEVKGYASFLRHARERIHAKLPQARVATTLTFGGMRNNADVTEPLIDASDLGVFTYYPLGRGKTPDGDGWIMRPISDVSSDLSWLGKQMGDKPFAFLEVGYSSHALNLGSEKKLDEFVEAIFESLDPYRRDGRLRFMQYWMLYDYPPELSERLAKHLGTTERGMVEYMSTLGLREYQHKGRERTAWKTYVEHANRWARER